MVIGMARTMRCRAVWACDFHCLLGLVQQQHRRNRLGSLVLAQFVEHLQGGLSDLLGIEDHAIGHGGDPAGTG